VKKNSADCYDAPKARWVLTIGASSLVRVEVDGKKVCVAPTSSRCRGSHKVKVTEVKSKQEDVSNIRIEAGKTVKITPYSVQNDHAHARKDAHLVVEDQPRC